MSRGNKKLLYGLFYFVILAGISFGTYLFFLKPEPVVVQEPTELDLLKLEIGRPQVLGIGEKTNIWIQVSNPSANYGSLDLEYAFNITSLIGGNLSVVDGRTSIYPKETKYILVTGVNIPLGDMRDVIFTHDVSFVEASMLPEQNISANKTEITFPEKEIQVVGFLLNDSPKDLERVKVSIFFLDASGEIVNNATTFVDQLNAFKEKEFFVKVPKTEKFIVPEKTQIFWEVSY